MVEVLIRWPDTRSTVILVLNELEYHVTVNASHSSIAVCLSDFHVPRHAQYSSAAVLL